MGGPTSGGQKKPERLRKLQGFAGHHPGAHAKDLAPRKVRAADLKVPAHFDAEERKIFRLISSKVEESGLLTTLDEFAIGRMASAYAKLREAENILDMEGITYAGECGGLKLNPAFSAVRFYENIIFKYLLQYGLTVQSRAHLTAPPDEEVDPLQEFLRAASEPYTRSKN